jgi:hypothetical protein
MFNLLFNSKKQPTKYTFRYYKNVDIGDKDITINHAIEMAYHAEIGEIKTVTAVEMFEEVSSLKAENRHSVDCYQSPTTLAASGSWDGILSIIERDVKQEGKECL